jgi:hypothetical protein
VSPDYLFDKDGEPDPDVRELEETLRPLAYEPRSFRSRSVTASRFTVWRLAVAASVLLAVTAGALMLERWTAPAFDVIRTHEAVVRNARLREGTWLETAAAETAAVKVADIGELTLAPDSKLRLLRTGAAEHRMELTRGSLRARVHAPPRLFVVETPSAVAVDLGCVYTLAVLPDKSTRLEVAVGQVELQGHGKRSVVPFDAEAISVAGKGPGLPISLRASASFRAAVDGFTRNPAAESQLRSLVESAEPADVVTLINLLPRVEANRRELILERVARFVPLPKGLTRDLAGDLDSAPMLALWERALEVREELDP